MDQPSSSGSQGNKEGSIRNKSDDAPERIVRSKVEQELHLLPLDVLRDILSRLSLKEVARMSVLSPEWKQLRICHPDLVFTKDTFFSKKTKKIKRAPTAAKFVAKVDAILHPLWSSSTTTTATLDKFVVKFGLGRKHKDRIDRWISFSTLSRTKHIALDFKLEAGIRTDHHAKYVFPLCNLSGPNGTCVTSLDLRCIYLKLPSSFCGIRNLKKLTLHSVSVSVSDFECLLLSCVLLESLNIQDIKWLSIQQCYFPSLCLHVELSGLQYLRMHKCNLDLIELHAPNLTTIDFDDGNQFQLVLNGSLKLSEATFKSYRTYQIVYDSLDYVLNKLPTDLPHLHTLFLDLGLETLVQSSSKTETRFMKLRYLNINCLIIDNLPGDSKWPMRLINLLKLAPLLEEFELHMDARGTRRPDSRLVRADSRLSKAVHGHPHPHLRSVYMTGFSRLAGVAELALYILRNATVLERMVIDPVVRKDRRSSNTRQIYSISKASEFPPPSPDEQELCDMKRDRRFAKRNLDREEYRHVLTIL